ncbi:RNA polymerase sigma-70 factor [Pedobacter sp. V48]|uniref:RNA polymerase sigma-70 factor n=1 Tax=Pedobacter sp. V48 TaxID=509635 RepID=UPI0003E5C08C|nr:RNA polymerase sigma-70 factor [Pedobacter sp. V48]ETZ19169.1 hypothetical protein N824_10535 [Pedobacter sp. V48]
MLWQQGDESAFEYLYKKYHMQFLSIAMQKTNDREKSMEFVQDTFITVFNNRASAHKITSFRAYFYTIVKNKILDHYRRTVLHKRYVAYSASHSPDAYEIHYIETRELEKLLEEEIKKLPPQCENIFRLRREQDMSNKQIAEQLNISVKTVEQHMTKALRLLKTAFKIHNKTLLILMLITLN